MLIILTVNPSSPNSVHHLTSPCMITAWPNIQAMRIKEMVPNNSPKITYLNVHTNSLNLYHKNCLEIISETMYIDIGALKP